MAIDRPEGRVVLSGIERSRQAAKYAGERALFFILLINPEMRDQRPEHPAEAIPDLDGNRTSEMTDDGSLPGGSVSWNR